MDSSIDGLRTRIGRTNPVTLPSPIHCFLGDNNRWIASCLDLSRISTAILKTFLFLDPFLAPWFLGRSTLTVKFRRCSMAREPIHVRCLHLLFLLANVDVHRRDRPRMTWEVVYHPRVLFSHRRLSGSVNASLWVTPDTPHRQVRGARVVVERKKAR
jgi:hypothetical protein